MSAIIKNIKEFNGLNSSTYPIGVDANNVVLSDGSYLEDALGNIDFFQNGSVIDQIKQVVPSNDSPIFINPTFRNSAKITDTNGSTTYATINSNGYNGVINGANSYITLPLVLKQGTTERGRITNADAKIQYLFPTNGTLEISVNKTNPDTKLTITPTQIRLTGPTYINDTIIVGIGTNGVLFNQAARFVKHVYLDNTTSFANTATFNGALTSNNIATFNNGLTMAANKTATIRGSVTVGQTATFNGALIANNRVTMAGFLNANGTNRFATYVLDNVNEERAFLQNANLPQGLYPITFSEKYSYYLLHGSYKELGGAMNGFLLKGATLGTAKGSATTRSILMNYKGQVFIRVYTGSRATANGNITWKGSCKQCLTSGDYGW